MIPTTPLNDIRAFFARKATERHRLFARVSLACVVFVGGIGIAYFGGVVCALGQLAGRMASELYRKGGHASQRKRLAYFIDGHCAFVVDWGRDGGLGIKTA